MPGIRWPRPRAGTLAQELELWTQRAKSSEARLAELARRRVELAPGTVGHDERAGGARATARRAGGAAPASSVSVVSSMERWPWPRRQPELRRSWTGPRRIGSESRESGARLEARLEQAQAEHAQAEAALRARLGHLRARARRSR